MDGAELMDQLSGADYGGSLPTCGSQAGRENMQLTNSWYAVHVRPRSEFSVARHLQAKGYERFIPLYRERRRWSDRVVDFELPLFPQYVFCHVAQATAGAIVTTPGVIRLVGAGNMPIAIDESEIEALQRIARTRLGMPWPYLSEGQHVELKAGPLKGLQGLLVRVASAHRLIVSVALLQRSVSVEVGADDVAPIGPVLSRVGAA